ncbi:PIN domain-containing protein [Thioclava sp. SK-1]|uniref:RSP_2648 family PIN domain-containing protein n=1 Tax=Thioclava sp. SK-1 TaxID=1889770 RepID=UPI000825B9CF|nr:PIN domain-containing protein [Thioclava sp. SK-1]OCX62297.1 PIN domain-containing protein [Thioclava sp. SK-1]
MKLCLDACVLYPTILREILIGCAQAGMFQPIWSERLLEEWARAAARRNPTDEVIARGEIALLTARFPAAMVQRHTGLETRLHLPDENDIHVLACAIAGGAEAIVTMNAKDFPRGVLASEGLERRDPDGLLWQFASDDRETVATIVEDIRATAERLSGVSQPLRALLKRARLPRLGKALV